MFINFEDMEAAGIDVHIESDKTGIRLTPKHCSDELFKSFFRTIKGTDLSRRKAEMLADEFAAKVFTAYVFQAIENNS